MTGVYFGMLDGGSFFTLMASCLQVHESCFCVVVLLFRHKY
jgi:hypothetical protein